MWHTLARNDPFGALIGPDRTRDSTRARGEEYKKEKRHPNYVILGVRRDHPRCLVEIEFGTRGSTTGVVPGLVFRQNRLRSFGAPKGRQSFLLRDAMHSADYAVIRCLSVCHTPVFCRYG